MATKQDLETWVKDALVELDGKGHLVAVAKIIWKNQEQELINSGDLFYTWQYDMRWAANKLRASGTMKSADISPSGVWELAEHE